MADFDDPADDVTRLELALEQIAALARRAGSAPREETTDLGAVAIRLDALIARLRSVLAE